MYRVITSSKHGLVNLNVTSEIHVLSQISSVRAGAAVSFTRFCGEDVIWGFPWKGGHQQQQRAEIHVAKVRNWCENESVHVGLTNGVSIKWYAEFFTSSRSRSSAFARQTKLRTTELNSAQLSPVQQLSRVHCTHRKQAIAADVEFLIHHFAKIIWDWPIDFRGAEQLGLWICRIWTYELLKAAQTCMPDLLTVSDRALIFPTPLKKSIFFFLQIQFLR